MSRTEFAAQQGVSRQAIDQAIAAGRLPVAPDGRIDLDAADETWGHRRQQHGEAAGAAGEDAKVAAFAAKARLLRQRLDDQEASLFERDVYLRGSLERVPATRAWLDGIPERHAAELAMVLGCSVETARGVLIEFLSRITVDLGDIAAEVTAAIAGAR